jgi:hypothetical protein
VPPKALVLEEATQKLQQETRKRRNEREGNKDREIERERKREREREREQASEREQRASTTFWYQVFSYFYFVFRRSQAWLCKLTLR